MQGLLYGWRYNDNYTIVIDVAPCSLLVWDQEKAARTLGTHHKDGIRVVT
jgi:hypothetical protein